MYDYSKLRGIIKEKFNTIANFANAIELSPTSVSKKLTNKIEWTQTEIDKAVFVLQISPQDISKYFFCVNN